MIEKINNTMVTAFLSEDCDYCVSQERIIRELAKDQPYIAIFISYSEEMMDQFKIASTPAILVANIETGETLISEGLVESDDIIEAIISVNK